MLFDTHTHIYLPEFDNDRCDTVQRARESGVQRMMLPNVDLDTVDALHRALDEYPDLCIAAMGLHPTSVDTGYRAALDRTLALLDAYPYHAVGEIGIDLYWDKTYAQEQIEVFETQVKWAASHNLPIIIHCREAFAEIIASLRRLSHLDVRGVFHSFGGTTADLAEIFSLGDFYIGINGIVSFKKCPLREVLPAIPTDRLLLETDAPYLAPVPFRGKRNEPAYVRHTAQFIADELHKEIVEIERETFANACRLFGISSRDEEE